MKNTLPITVVIPTYNRARWLRECLASVARQSVRPREVIVVDDGSTDETEPVCRREWPEIEYCYQANRGVSAARNRGIRMAGSEWIALLDSDDLWEPTKLERQWAVLQSDPQLKALQTEEIWLRNGKRVNPRRIHAKPSGWLFAELIPVCLVSPSAVIIHREVFEKVGDFDETLPACEDYDLWLRMALHYRIETLREALTIKRGGHADQLSRQWGLDRYRIQSLKKLLQECELTKEQRTLVETDIQRRCRILVSGFKKHGDAAAARYYSDLEQLYAV